MKTLMLTLFAVLSLCCGIGCVSQQGRLAVLDIDFRKAAQLEAGTREAEAPFRNWTSVEQPAIEEVETEALPLAWWEMLMNMISKLECRFTLVRIEWADHRKCQTQAAVPTLEVIK